MTKRQSIEIEGLSHLASIPVATRIGPLLITSVISSFNPGTRDVPEATADQVANIYTHTAKILAAAGATWENVAKMEFWAPSNSVRAEIDAIWVQHFPDKDARPSRHIHIDGTNVSASMIAYLGD
jgi:2-iminobutanoate/2-iminopropanoate deaminase